MTAEQRPAGMPFDEAGVNKLLPNGQPIIATRMSLLRGGKVVATRMSLLRGDKWACMPPRCLTKEKCCR